MEIQLKVQGLEKLKASLENARQVCSPIVAKAINASLVEIQNEANDSNFQFKTPRSQRTGMLQLSFKYGFTFATENLLKGGIGPTVKYAVYVHEGTNRGIQPNPFMVRIVAKVQPKVNDIFGQALEQISKALAK